MTVRVLEVKLDKKQIALTMKSERAAGERAGGERSGGEPQQRDRPARPADRDRGRPPAPAPSKPATPFNNPFAAALANKNPRR